MRPHGGRFGGATLAGVRFDHCHLEETDFNGAELTDVDLRGSDLRLGGDVAALRGAIIDTGQAIDLAPRMAASLGPQGRRPLTAGRSFGGIRRQDSAMPIICSLVNDCCRLLEIQ